MNPSLKVSRVGLAFALFLFIFPFVRLSCQGQAIVSLTGVQLITGTSIEEPGSGSPKREADGEFLALLAFVCGLVAAVYTFVRIPKATVVTMVASGGAALCLLLLKLRIDSLVFRQGEGVIQTSYGIAFWLAFLIFSGGCAFHGYQLRQSMAAPTSSVRTEPAAPA
jgi:hypothetical protein